MKKEILHITMLTILGLNLLGCGSEDTSKTEEQINLKKGDNYTKPSSDTSSLKLDMAKDKSSFTITFNSNLSTENYNASYSLKSINPVLINPGINTNGVVITTCNLNQDVGSFARYKCSTHYELPSNLEGYKEDYSQTIALFKEQTYKLYLENHYKNSDMTSTEVASFKL